MVSLGRREARADPRDSACGCLGFNDPSCCCPPRAHEPDLERSCLRERLGDAVGHSVVPG